VCSQNVLGVVDERGRSHKSPFLSYHQRLTFLPEYLKYYQRLERITEPHIISKNINLLDSHFIFEGWENIKAHNFTMAIHFRKKCKVVRSKVLNKNEKSVFQHRIILNSTCSFITNLSTTKTKEIKQKIDRH
jgi:hypothetical protein